LYWRQSAVRKYIMKYLERWNKLWWLLVSILLNNHSSITLLWLRRKIMPRSESCSKGTIFNSEWIWSWSWMQNLTSTWRSFCITCELHALDAFLQQIAVLLMDNCLNHIISDLIRLLTEAWMCVITFVLYTTQIFQILNLALCDALKWHPRYEFRFEDEKGIVKFIIKVYHEFK
jgi:hypothetical protein